MATKFSNQVDCIRLELQQADDSISKLKKGLNKKRELITRVSQGRGALE